MPSQTITLTKPKTGVMADGLNEARALRVTEILRDYQSIQRRIGQFQASPRPDECNEIGYSSLRACHADARTLLAVPYPPEMLHPPARPNEAEKRQLQRVILDASARRFQAQKIYLRAAAAFKWVQRRQAVLQGRKPQAAHSQALKEADKTLRNELAAITNERVANAFRAADSQAGYWLSEDPELATVLAWVRTHY